MTEQKYRLASKVIRQSDFNDIPQMNRWRRLVTKYKNSHLILNGNVKDWKVAVAAFMILEELNIEAIAMAAALKSIFTDSLEG